jgi:purine nucleoside permease
MSPACGLQRHDADAVHCKACGVLLNITDEGQTWADRAATVMALNFRGIYL